MENKTHTRGRDCPVCKGYCQLAQLNSASAPYEEIQAEIERRRRIEDARKKLGE